MANITVIVPVHKLEQNYIVGCIESIKNQKEKPFEVLFVTSDDKDLNDYLNGYDFGNLKNVTKVIKKNIEEFEKKGTKTLFTACAGCYRTWKKDYPELLGEELPFEVKHITEILVDLLNNNQIPFKEKEQEEVKVTYHDPCHLGRHMNLYDIPREVISKIPGINLIEMKRTKNNAWCCGAGGGVKSQFPDLALKISEERIKEAIETGAQILTTSCPFCLGNFRNAYEDLDAAIKEKIKVVDIIDLIASKL